MTTDFATGFANQIQEFDLTELPIQGAIPQWLRGVLLRNGPAIFDLPNAQYRHWFDGLAMIQRFEFDQGKIAYRNRLLHSRSYEHAMLHGEIGFSEFASSPRYRWWQRLINIFGAPKYSDNAAVLTVRRWH